MVQECDDYHTESYFHVRPDDLNHCSPLSESYRESDHKTSRIYFARESGNSRTSTSLNGACWPLFKFCIQYRSSQKAMFTTARLRLRGHKPTDNESLLALYNDPLVAPWINEGFVVPKHHSFLDRITTFLDSALMMCIVEEIETGEFVGLTGFVAQAETKNRNAVMMIALMPKFHRKGYGYEAMRWLIGYAFEGMNMHRVSLTVFEGNDKALALYLKLGFIEEGRHRKIVWIDGAWKDTIYMGILEDEWPGLKTREVHSI